MAQPAKFEFDTVFERTADGRVSLPNTFRKADIDAARAEGYAEGYSAGQSDALVKAEQDCAAVLQQIGNRIGQITSTLETERRRLAEEACLLARVLSAKIAPALFRAHPSGEIESMLSEALTHLSDTPNVVVRINEAWLDRIQPRIDAIAQSRGFTGKVILLAEPDLQEVDCRIEWADGGIARDTARLEHEIDGLIERYIGRHLPQHASCTARPDTPDETQGEM